MQHSLQKVKRGILKLTEGYQDEEEQIYVLPEELTNLTYRTGFTRDEIRKLYRCFKQYCPGGVVTTNDLRPTYAKLFPLGDSRKYAQLVFKSFDNDCDGIVSFSDLIAGIAIIINGNVDQKLSWIFQFYDLNRDGRITKPEMMFILSAIYEMINDSQSIKYAVDEHTDRLFARMDIDKDGIISKNEFMETCKNDMLIHNQLLAFDKLWI